MQFKCKKTTGSLPPHPSHSYVRTARGPQCQAIWQLLKHGTLGHAERAGNNVQFYFRLYVHCVLYHTLLMGEINMNKISYVKRRGPKVMVWLAVSWGRHLFQYSVGRRTIKHRISSAGRCLMRQISLVKHFSSYVRAVEIRFEIQMQNCWIRNVTWNTQVKWHRK
jgi:hypothetical protein